MRGRGSSNDKVNALSYTSTSARPALNIQDEDKKRKFKEIEIIMEKNEDLYQEDDTLMSDDSDSENDNEWWKEQESSHAKKKMNRNLYDQNTESNIMDATTEKPHPHTERNPDQEPDNHINNIEVSGSTIVIQFINESRDANIIHDKGTLHHLLNNSPFAGAIDGKGRFSFSKHEYIINIKNNNDLAKLLSVEHLDNKDTGEIWPIQCRELENFHDNSYVVGVLKNIHPSVLENRIQDEINRNKTRNEQNGIIILESHRIKKSVDGALTNTYCVKIKFSGQNKPNNIAYGGEIHEIHDYTPQVVICFRCSKTGHIAKYCSRPPKCGFCGEKHESRNCGKDNTNISLRRCPNCQKNHVVSYGGCQFIKVEKKVIRLSAGNQNPKYELRKQLWAEVAARNSNRRVEATQNPISIEPTQTHQREPELIEVSYQNPENTEINTQISNNPRKENSSNSSESHSNQRYFKHSTNTEFPKLPQTNMVQEKHEKRNTTTILHNSEPFIPVNNNSDPVKNTSVHTDHINQILKKFLENLATFLITFQNINEKQTDNEIKQHQIIDSMENIFNTKIIGKNTKLPSKTDTPSTSKTTKDKSAINQEVLAALFSN